MTWKESAEAKGLFDTYRTWDRAKLEDSYVFLLMDCSDTDIQIEELCRGILTDAQIEGDSYGVPGSVGLVEMLVEKIKKHE